MDSWQVLQLPHLYLLWFCQELTTITHCCLVLLMMWHPTCNGYWTMQLELSCAYKIACLYYHSHSSTAPSYVTDMLHKKPLHTRNTRSSSYTMPLLNRPAHSKATLGDRSFSFAPSSVWNYVPNDIRCAPSLSSFKSRLKTYLFRSVYKDWTVSLITVHMFMVRPCHSFVDGISKNALMCM